MDGRKEKRPIHLGTKSKENNSEKIFTIHMTKAHFSYCTKRNELIEKWAVYKEKIQMTYKIVYEKMLHLI